MKSWSNKVFFFSSNSISFASLTRTNFLYIHTGNEVEEALEKQEQERRQEKNRNEYDRNERHIVMAMVQVLVGK